MISPQIAFGDGGEGKSCLTKLLTEVFEDFKTLKVVKVAVAGD